MELSYEQILNLFKETDRKFQETDRKFQETDRKFQDTDRKFQDYVKEARQLSLESDRKFQADKEMLREMTKATNRQIADLGNRLGGFVQEMVKPALVRLFQERGIEVHYVLNNIETKGEFAFEIDLLVVNNNHAIAVECKSKLKQDDVDEHLERVAKIKKVLYQYENTKIMAGVAAMVVPDNVANYAMGKGLFVLAQSGEVVNIVNGADFKPQYW